MSNLIQDIIQIVREKHMTDCSAHDFDHVMRVFNLAKTIAKTESGVDPEVLQLSALLHDIGGAKESNDPTGRTDHAVVGSEMAEEILGGLGYDPARIRHVKDCILTHRYRTDKKPESIEAKILFDADKLETVGAIGVARAFAWVGRHGAKIYKKPESLEDYIRENLGGKINGRIREKSKHSVHINYETKDKYLLEKLYTESARKIGRERLEYYKNFLDRLEREVNGKQ